MKAASNAETTDVVARIVGDEVNSFPTKLKVSMV